MKRAKFLAPVLLLILLFVIAACGSRPQDTPIEETLTEEIAEDTQGDEMLEVSEVEATAEVISITFDDILATANLRRQNTFEPDMDRVHALIYGRDPSVIEWERLFYAPRAHAISTEEAIEDVMILFDLLKHWYAAYNYFGGDEVFLPLRDSILDSLSEMERVVTAMLSMQLQEALAQVIADNHFVFNGVTIGVRNHRFVWETPFDKTENGFVHRDTGRLLVNIEGHSIDEVFRLAANEYGEFFYLPVFLRDEEYGGIYAVTFIFENGDQERIIMNDSWMGFAQSPIPTLEFTDSIPVVTMRGNMPFPAATSWDESFYLNPDYGQLFLSFAEELQDEDVIIIDIRTNLGGSGELGRIWFYMLTGNIIPGGHVGIYTHGITPPNAMESLPKHWYQYFNPLDETIEYFDAWAEIFDQFSQIDDYHTMDFVHATPGFSNDTLLILLIDRFSSSAAEFFTSHVLNMENTLVIGQNTGGVLLTSGFHSLHLPNSGLPVVMGPSFFMHPENQWQEGIGYAPDIWVIGDALTAALAIANNR